MNQCPICKLQLSNNLPEFCERCGWELRNDLTLVPSLDLPDEAIEDYTKRVGVARRHWEERVDALRKQKELEERLKALESGEIKAVQPQSKISSVNPADSKSGAYSENTPVPDLKRDPFETVEDFESRINGYPPVKIGDAELIRDRYDYQTRIFPLKIAWKDWAGKINGLPEKDADIHVLADLETAKAIYQSGPAQGVYAKFKAKGESAIAENLVLAANGLEFEIHTPGSQEAGQWIEPLTGMAFIHIPAGSFLMGSPDSEAGRYDDEGPVHEVTLDGFSLGQYPVTNAQYRKWKPDHDSGEHKGHTFNGDHQPVVNVSWEDAAAYAEWMSQKAGRNFRLPSEAEWEYACRAGTRTARFWGDNPDEACKYANVLDQTTQKTFNVDQETEIHKCDCGYAVTSPVGSFQPNAWGLYDMIGNIWEWCQDIYASDCYSKHAKKNPIYASGGSYRVLRGGSWYDVPRRARCARRYNRSPSDRDDGIGFRLAST